MTVADAQPARSRPPAPEECDHPAPVRGVMAHEFATYAGAMGPEGRRRTVTHYGPVVGGLPIQAWHCERCGLLRLSFPDGRREERRLFPGPQPGLIAAASAVATESVLYGRQARVSGLSFSPDLLAVLEPEAEPLPLFSLPSIPLPAYDVATWMTIVLLAAVSVGLFLAGVLAVYTYQTPDSLTPLLKVVGSLFAATLAVQIGAAVQRQHFPMPRLSPSVASALRGRPSWDAATGLFVFLMTLVLIGLLLIGILAVYTWQTSDAVAPVAIVTAVCFGLALLVKVADAARRHFLR